LPATSGTVRFAGDDITKLAPHARARRSMAYTPQGREIFPALSVYDNLRLGLLKTG
jgi:branched-chain amino acid transport system ATP-binding protein